MALYNWLNFSHYNVRLTINKIKYPLIVAFEGGGWTGLHAIELVGFT